MPEKIKKTSLKVSATTPPRRMDSRSSASGLELSQSALSDSKELTPAKLLALQRTAGNQAVQRLLAQQRSPNVRVNPAVGNVNLQRSSDTASGFDPKCMSQIEFGSSDKASVRTLQTLLNLWGKDHGKAPLAIDEDFGVKTKAAVIEFQSAHGLDADGVVGPQTWAVLARKTAHKTEHSIPQKIAAWVKGLVSKLKPDFDSKSSSKTFSDVASGDERAFAKTLPEAQTAFIKMATEYQEKTGKKIVLNSSYRSQAEQTVLYERWIAAGGNKDTKPYAAGLHIPSRSNGSHGGWAFDMNTSIVDEIVSMSLHTKYGFVTVTNDPVHLQLSSYRPGVDRRE